MPSLKPANWLLVFTLFALPLLFSPFSYLAFELPKVFLFYLFTVISTFLLLKSGYRLTKLNLTSLLFIIFLTWMVLAAILGLNFQQSLLGSYFRWQGIITWLCFGLLFFASSKLTENYHFKRYISLAILISSFFVASFAITQFILLWFFGYTSQLLYSNRVISTFGQPNFLGAYLVMSLPFIWFLLKETSRKWKFLVYLSLAIVVLGIFSTLSRSAYLGLLVLSLIWGFYHYRLLLTAITFSIIIFGILATLFPNLVFQEWYRFKLDSVSKWTAENRLQIMEKTSQLISHQPIFGYGWENFSLAFPTVVNVDDFGLKDIVVDSSHNLFLDLIVQTGLIGLILFILLIITTVVFGFKQNKSENPTNQSFFKAAVCSIVAFLVIHQFSPYSIVPLVLFWLSLGIVNKPALQHFILSKTNKLLISIFGIVLTAITITIEIQTIRADYFFHQASAYEVDDIYKAIDLDDQAISLAPWIRFYQIRRDFLLKQLGY